MRLSKLMLRLGMLAVVQLHQHRLMVRRLGLGIHGDGVYAAREVLADEDEVAAIGSLAVALRMHAERGRVRVAAVRDRPRVAIRRGARRKRLLDLRMRGILRREVEVA